MIYNLFSKFMFIHIPRCSGTSMNNALLRVFPHSLVGADALKHARVPKLYQMLGEAAWKETYKFAVIRSPWEIIESYWRHTRLSFDNLLYLKPDTFWYNHVIEVSAYQTFQEYVEKQYIQKNNVNLNDDMGFWQTYCCNRRGGEMGVRPILISEVELAWVTLCGRFNIKEPPAYPLDNLAPYSPGQWTEELVEMVGERCKDDIQRFGFREPTYE